jgi:hypothetical protein
MAAISQYNDLKSILSSELKTLMSEGLINTFLGLYDINRLIAEGDLSQIGEITYEDLNNTDQGVTSIDVVFTGAKTTGMYVAAAFLINVDTFTTYASGLTISSAGFKWVAPDDMSTFGKMTPRYEQDNIIITVNLSAENLQDWLTGAISVFVSLKPIPIA